MIINHNDTPCLVLKTYKNPNKDRPFYYEVMYKNTKITITKYSLIKKSNGQPLYYETVNKDELLKRGFILEEIK